MKLNADISHCTRCCFAIMHAQTTSSVFPVRAGVILLTLDGDEFEVFPVRAGVIP